MTIGDHRFHRWINPAGRAAPLASHRIEATEAERAALAAWLEIPAIRALHASISLARASTGSVAATGSLVADVDLVCGVTLDVFGQRLESALAAVFSQAATESEATISANPEVDLEADDPRAWTGQGIDLGAWLAEELSLALPDFPRKPGVMLIDGAEGLPDEKPRNPFAVLLKLSRKDD